MGSEEIGKQGGANESGKKKLGKIKINLENLEKILDYKIKRTSGVNCDPNVKLEENEKPPPLTLRTHLGK